jgi:hypothetical protein
VAYLAPTVHNYSRSDSSYIPILVELGSTLLKYTERFTNLCGLKFNQNYVTVISLNKRIGKELHEWLSTKLKKN